MSTATKCEFFGSLLLTQADLFLIDCDELCRERVHDISWFMSALNEHIATTFEDSCGPWVGGSTRLAQVCGSTGKYWICATEGNQKLYPP